MRIAATVTAPAMAKRFMRMERRRSGSGSLTGSP
jgi:hypothetical protein